MICYDRYLPTAYDMTVIYLQRMICYGRYLPTAYDMTVIYLQHMICYGSYLPTAYDILWQIFTYSIWYAMADIYLQRMIWQLFTYSTFLSVCYNNIILQNLQYIDIHYSTSGILIIFYFLQLLINFLYIIIGELLVHKSVDNWTMKAVPHSFTVLFCPVIIV